MERPQKRTTPPHPAGPLLQRHRQTCPCQVARSFFTHRWVFLHTHTLTRDNRFSSFFFVFSNLVLFFYFPLRAGTTLNPTGGKCYTYSHQRPVVTLIPSSPPVVLGILAIHDLLYTLWASYTPLFLLSWACLPAGVTHGSDGVTILRPFCVQGGEEASF